MGYDPNLLQEFSESSSASSMANVCCSIELEPRTLSQGQISQARVKSLPRGAFEVAADIIQKKEPSEACNIFVEGGLKPVASIKDLALMVQEIETLNVEDGAKDKINNNTETACQCSCTPSMIDSPDLSPQLKEPLSAPF